MSILEADNETTADNIVSKIKVFSFYISNNELFDAQSTSIFIENNFLSKEKLLYLIKQNQRHNNKKYKLVSLLKFDLDINIETFITETLNAKNNISPSLSFLHSLKELDSITFKNTNEITSNLNCVYLLYNQISSSPNTANNTKRIVIKSFNKTKRKTT